jgi:hypothetical protein
LSKQLTEIIEMEGCRGLGKKHEENGEFLAWILKVCSELCNLNLEDMLVKSGELYRLPGRLRSRMKCVIIGIATEEAVICCLETCFQLFQAYKGVLNGELGEEAEIIAFYKPHIIVNVYTIT